MSEVDEFMEEEEEEVSKIPKDVLDYAYTIVDLQNLLNDLNPQNINETVIKLTKSQYFTDKSLLKNFISHLLEVPNFCPNRINFICDFLNQLFQSVEKQEAIKVIQNELLRQLLLLISNPNPFPNESSSPKFLYQLYKHGVLTIKMINEQIQHFIKNYTSFSEPIAWIVCYFIDLVPENVFNETKQRVSNSKNCNRLFKEFFKNYKYNQQFDNPERKNMNMYVEALRQDDVEKLNDLLKPSYNYDSIILPNIFEECWFIQREPSLISCAAYFGSIKCFKFLLLNHANLKMKDQNSKSLAQFAVAGGNSEIVRLVEQAGCDFSDTLQIATIFYQQDIFDWLHLNKFTDLKQDIYDPNSTLHNAASSGNINILVKCINSGCSTKKFTKFPDRQSPILRAAENGKSDALKILLSVPQIDPNMKYKNETPLIFAARNGRDECVRILCDSEKVDVNETGKIGTALHYAAYFCQTDVARILINSKKIDTSVINQNGETAFHVAKNVGAKEIEKMLEVKRSTFSRIADLFNRYYYFILIALLFIYWY